MRSGTRSLRLVMLAAALLSIGFTTMPIGAAPTRAHGGCGCAARVPARPSALSSTLTLAPPRSVVMRPDSGGPYSAKVYVADELSGTVSVIDARTNERIRTIQISYREGDMV